MTATEARPDEQVTADEIIRVLYRKDGSRSLRPVHAIGIAVRGVFVPSAVAAYYCRAEMFRPRDGGYPALVRFSNGSGCAEPHDDWSDVRGMATRFTLPGERGAEPAFADLIAMTLPQFFSRTPEGFWRFAKAAQPVEVVAQGPWQKLRDMLRLMLPVRNPYPGETISPDAGAMAFADGHDEAKAGVFGAAAIGAPVSYFRAAYHAVHTFFVTDAAGVRRPVRFSWQPVLGVRSLPATAPYAPVPPGGAGGDRYLQAELRARLAAAQGRDGPRFTLMMVLGETGDDLDDPSRVWPGRRQRISMGTLSLFSVVEDAERDCERVSFNPGLLAEGMALSDDPVLRFRVETYQRSSALRGATPCPFARRAPDGTEG